MAKREKKSYVIQSVSNALNLLEEFKGNRDELGVTELSKMLNLHKNNVFRLLATLEAKGYIEQKDDGDYKSLIPFTEIVSHLYMLNQI